MAFQGMIFVLLIVLATTSFPTSSSIRSYSKHEPSLFQNQTTHSEPIPTKTETKSSRTGFTFPLLHRNHTKVVKELGILKEPPLDEVDEFAPMSKSGALFYVNFLVGSEKESILAVFDTGSSFTWMEIHKSSTTFTPLSCHDVLCGIAPNGHCGYHSDKCPYNSEYVGGAVSKGFVGTDSFHYFNSDGDGHIDRNSTTTVQMVFGVADEKPKYPGVMGVTGTSLGILKALDEITFSVCFPRDYSQESYLKLGLDAYLDGASTPLVFDWNMHLAFDVSSIDINGFRLSNLTDKPRKGGKFIFDSGAWVTQLHPVAMDEVVGLLKEMINAEPLDRRPRGFELCYYSDQKKAYADIAFSLNFEGGQGGGSMKLNFKNLWTMGDESTAYCLAFQRSSSNRTIYGALQMQGWNFGFDLHDKQLWIKEDDCLIK